VTILGIETSCDETAAAVVRDGRQVLSSVVYTQIPLHVPYGGVVPEIASRAHIEKISEVIRTALKDAGNPPIDAVAVTYGPGLSPALIVGLNAAKGLAKSLDVPLIAVNHIEAHLRSTHKASRVTHTRHKNSLMSITYTLPIGEVEERHYGQRLHLREVYLLVCHRTQVVVPYTTIDRSHTIGTLRHHKVVTHGEA
jgi:hypothetical protein